MFLVRSIFWLALAFLVLGPKDFDFGRTAQDLSSKAVATGHQAVVEAVLNPECSTLQCTGAKAALAAVRSPAAQPAVKPAAVPLPRPRPDHRG